MLIPRQTVPALAVPTLSHGTFNIATDSPEQFSLVVFYRGLHCPICHKYLLELGRLLPEFTKRGVKVIALSSDTEERAQAMADKLNAPDLRVGTACPWRLHARGVFTSARPVGRHPSASRSPRCFPSRGSSLFVQTRRCTTAPSRPCPLPVPILMS